MITRKQPPSVGFLSCDKLTFTLPLAPAEHGHVVETLDWLIETAYAKKSYSPMYLKCAAIGVGPNNIETLLVQTKPRKPNMSFLRVEFNPSKSPMSEVRTYLDEVIPTGGYERLIASGWCTRLDLAVDIHRIAVHTLAVTYPKLLVTANHYAQARLQTEYLGAESSSKRVCVYDKTAQVKKNNSKILIKQPIPEYPTTRIEIRLMHRFKAMNIATLPNPYLELGVSRATFSMLSEECFRLFWLAAQTTGAQTALLALSPLTRNKIVERLKLATLPCWQPGMLWNQWPSVAAQITHPPKSSLSLKMLMGDFPGKSPVQLVALH